MTIINAVHISFSNLHVLLNKEHRFCILCFVKILLKTLSDFFFLCELELLLQHLKNCKSLLDANYYMQMTYNLLSGLVEPVEWASRLGYWTKDLTDGVKSKFNSRKCIDFNREI